jgi:hypothetical protein
MFPLPSYCSRLTLHCSVLISHPPCVILFLTRNFEVEFLRQSFLFMAIRDISECRKLSTTVNTATGRHPKSFTQKISIVFRIQFLAVV